MFRLSRTAHDIQNRKGAFQQKHKRAIEVKKQFEDGQRRASELAHKNVRDEAQQNKKSWQRVESLVREQKERQLAIEKKQRTEKPKSDIDTTEVEG